MSSRACVRERAAGRRMCVLRSYLLLLLLLDLDRRGMLARGSWPVYMQPNRITRVANAWQQRPRKAAYSAGLAHSSAGPNK